MGKFKVRMNKSGARELLNSVEMQEELLSRAERIRERADSVGSGTYKADVQAGKNRAHAMVKTTDIVSQNSNKKHNTLLKSMDAGRD